VSNWVPILAYHRICDTPLDGDPLRLCTPPKDLERVLRYLRSRPYRFVSFDEAVDAVTGDRSHAGRLVALTFDDGYEDFYTNAFPILQAYNLPATVFLVSGCIDATNRWDDRYGLPPVPLMTQRQIVDLATRGIDFGSHTVSHPRLTRLDAAEQEREVFDSKRTIEDLLGRPVRSFCYPHMDHNEHVRTLVRDAGYTRACGGEQSENGRYLVHRINVSQSGWVSTLFRIWGWRHAMQRNRSLRSLRHALLPEADSTPELTEVRR
jgi:peptidoglycan/xylan/chitin deacetylase (PgdA/CDA1 family)